MKNIKIYLYILSYLVFNTLHSQNKDYCVFVNPFIGSDGHGHTYPGAVMPFGMIQLSPDTRLSGWDGCSGYHYSDSVIYGFTHTHLNGTGCLDYGDILLMPVDDKSSVLNSEYSSKFNHSNEKAFPAYYSVVLDKFDIEAEFTVTKRCGIHHYTFPESVSPAVILDLSHRDLTLDSYIEIINNNEIRGYRHSSAWAKDQVIFFEIKLGNPFEKVELYLNDTLNSTSTKLKGRNVKAKIIFKKNLSQSSKSTNVYLSIGISGTSIDGAKNNLKIEIPTLPDSNIFKNTLIKSKNEWNNELGKITVDGGMECDKQIFYTAMYHTFLNPNLFSDTDGKYRGLDKKNHTSSKGDVYTVFSLWDTYRAFHPLLTIIDTKRTNDFINTFINQYKQGGLLPVWELAANETNCMIGYHSVSVIADAYLKGIKNYDTLLVFEAMKKSANQEKNGVAEFNKTGFLLSEKEHESVSKTLEYAYDDWCIAMMAKKLGITKDYFEFIQRAQFYKNLFDSSTGFMRAKYNCGWYSPFDPTEINSNYTEANAWQYSFYVPQDISGMINLYGSKQNMANKLDELFSASQKLTGRDQPDVTGLICQYAHGNEPSHHIAYLYDYVNQPWKTQKLVHEICNKMYSCKPNGLCGNEDCGQMSAWYVFSSIGFYPVCPGQMQYAIGTPRFAKTIINIENGKHFIIQAKNLNDSNYYIQSIYLNGKLYDKYYINHSDIINGGLLIFEMGNKPNYKIKINDDNFPSTSITQNQIISVPVVTNNEIAFKKNKTIQLVSYGNKIFYTTDKAKPSENSNVYNSPIEIKESTTVKAFAIDNFGNKSKAIEACFIKLPDDWKVTLTYPPSNLYTAGGEDALIDKVRGISNFRIGKWQGYRETNFEAIVDLGKEIQIKRIGAGFLQDVDSWIWFPKYIEIYSSNDGINYTKLTRIDNTVSPYDYSPQIKDFTADLKFKARYIKIFAENFGTIPDWHVGKGERSWIFVDEIIIE